MCRVVADLPALIAVPGVSREQTERIHVPDGPWTYSRIDRQNWCVPLGGVPARVACFSTGAQLPDALAEYSDSLATTGLSAKRTTREASTPPHRTVTSSYAPAGSAQADS
jgi:hypothetical protein